MPTLSKSEIDIFKKAGSKAPINPIAIRKLSDYFSVIEGLFKVNPQYWFRGHSDFTYLLTPSALRYKSISERNRAIELVDAFKRYAEGKLRKIPLDQLKLD